MILLNNCMSQNDYQNQYRSDIDQWTEMWDEIQGDEEFSGKEELIPSPSAGIGNRPQDDYYDFLDSGNQFPDEESVPEEEGLLQEAKKKKRVVESKTTMNPVYPDSVGADSENPKPAWVNENLLKEIENLKKRLFQVENKMAKMGQGKKWPEKPIASDDSKIMSEIKMLQKRINKLSDSLGVEDEVSPWRVAR